MGGNSINFDSKKSKYVNSIKTKKYLIQMVLMLINIGL